jgi:hypothetical protein
MQQQRPIKQPRNKGSVSTFSPRILPALVLHTQPDRTTFRAAEPDSRHSSFVFDVQLYAEFVCYPYSAASIKLACAKRLSRHRMGAIHSDWIAPIQHRVNRFDERYVFSDR